MVRRALMCVALSMGAADRTFAAKLDTSKSLYVSEVTFPGYTNETTLCDFQALIRLPAGCPILAAAAADGSDVRVAMPDGTLLPHEIDQWNAQGESTLWVRLPTLVKGETKVFLYCGGSPEPSLPTSDVWTGYRGVWHFSGSSADSTANGFDGTDSATPPTFADTGPIGTVCTCGQNRYTVVEDRDIWTGLQGHTPGFTVSAWVSSQADGYNRILSTQVPYGSGAQNQTGFELCQWGNPSAYYVVGKQGWENQVSGAVSCHNNYVLLTAVFSGGSNKLYVNGALAKQQNGWMDIDTPLTGLFIGAKANRDAFWQGGIDEVRMNFAPLSPERVAADYATQADASFVRLGEMRVVDGKLDTSKLRYVSEVTFPGYTNETALSGFPVLIRIPSGSPILALAAADGSDVRVTLPDCTLLPHEIDQWNTHGESTLWVRLPTLVKGVTKILLYCGGSPEQSLPASDVWKDYRGVWHFSGSSADSTANGFDGTDSATPPTFANPGLIGKAYSGGTDRYTVITNRDIWSGFQGLTPGFTVSAWVNSLADGYNRILSTQVPYGGGEQNQTGFELCQWGNPSAYYVVGKQGWENQVSGATSCYGNYVHLTAVFSGGTNKLYVNGVLAKQHDGWMDIDTPLTGLFIGAKANHDAFWQGGIDEVRMNFAPLSDERIAADYASQSDIAFARIGELRVIGGTKLDTSKMLYVSEVSFPGYTNETSQGAFPALIRIPADSPILLVSATDGSDVRVTLPDGTLLPHEIDQWDAHGESTLWVRLPTLVKGVTKVLLYCGGKPEQSLPASDVWKDYRGVWHFSGSSADSTANGFDGTDSATPPTFANPGPIGKAYSGGTDRYTVITNRDIWSGFQGHTPGFTVSAWVSSLADGYNRILSTQVPYGGGEQNQTGFELCQWGNPSAYYVVGKQGWENQVSGATSCHNNYVHLTAVFSGGTNRLYVNGELAAQHDGWMDIDTPLTGLFIGAKANTNAFWQGGIDEVRINFAPLSPERVAADYAMQSDAAFAKIGEMRSLAFDDSTVPYESDSSVEEMSGRKTGYFHVEELGGRPMLVDPLGRGYTVLGVDHVGPGGWFCQSLGYSPYGRHVQTAYRDVDEWVRETIGRLKTWGFNTLGNSGSAIDVVGRRGLSHAIWLDMCARMCNGSPEWRILPDRQGRGSLFPNVFHPDFEKECDSLAKQRCAPCRNDPWLLGYYIDNELSWWGFEPLTNWEDYGPVLFDIVRAEEPTHTARQALEKFLNGREPTPELKVEFTRLVAERYFSVTTAAIRRHDPYHLILGCRFAGDAAHPVVFEEAGKYCDVVTLNFYPQADLYRNRLMDWAGHTATAYLSNLYERAKRPLLVTEWSFPAIDAGCPCLFGAGQRFYTQAERTQASELCAKTLLAHEGCLGYNYFMWVDEPALGVSGPKSEDSNYGLVNERGVPYAELTDMFTRLHAESWKWRTSPPPPERAYTPPDPVSEWDQFVAATTGDCGRVDFARVGADWRLSNSAGLVLSGRLGGRLLVDEISLAGKAIGNYGAMIKINVSGPDRWLRATNLVDVSFAPGQDGRTGRLLLTSDGRDDEGVSFRLVHRLFVSGGTTAFAAQVVSVENRGKGSIDLRSAFMLPLACEAESEIIDMVPNLWRGPRTCGWRLKDGSTYVIASHDPSVGVCSFSVDAGGTYHGECEFLLSQPRLLQSGETYCSDIPMSAVLTPSLPRRPGMVILVR